MPHTEPQHSTASTESQVSHLSVKIPPLWKSNIKLWFVQVESNFALAKITNDLTKYNHLIASIDPETLSTVSDILFTPPATDKYETLKTRLIAEFSASETEQIRRLISGLHLGDEKPTHLLRKMRELGGKGITDDFLKTLWLQRLPPEIQAILSISSESLDNLATMADKISEVRASPPENSVFAVGQSKVAPAECISPLSAELAELKGTIAALSKQVEHLSRDRNRMPFHRDSSRHRNSSRGRSSDGKKDFCYYHRRFGKNAKKCQSPCSFRPATDQENSQ